MTRERVGKKTNGGSRTSKDDGPRRRFIRIPRPKSPGGQPVAGHPRPSTPPTPQKPAEPNEQHRRVVIPRQLRPDSRRSSASGMELWEVRYGAVSRVPYLRLVPSRQRLKPQGPAHIEA